MSSEQPEASSATRVIKQLIPTANFVAVFYDEESGEPWVDSVVLWALVSDPANGSAQSIIGMVADEKDILFVDEFPNFIGYLSPEGSLNDWRERAQEAFEKRQESDQSGALRRG
jgi:hypothetical protein